MNLQETQAAIEGPASSLPDFHRGFVEAAFWQADPNPGPGEFYLNEEDWESLPEGDRETLIKAATTFKQTHQTLIDTVCRLQPDEGGFKPKRGLYSEHQAGIDFYLSSCGSGSGFRDRGTHPHWELLHNLSKSCKAPELHFFCTEAGDCNGPGNCDACDNRDGQFEVT